MTDCWQVQSCSGPVQCNHRCCDFGVSLSLKYHTQFWSVPEVTVTSETSQFVYPEVANIQGKRTGEANQILPSLLGGTSLMYVIQILSSREASWKREEAEFQVLSVPQAVIQATGRQLERPSSILAVGSALVCLHSYPLAMGPALASVSIVTFQWWALHYHQSS